MRKAIVFNDIHLFSKYNDDPSLKDKLDSVSPNFDDEGAVVVLNGDIVDLSACKKKDVKSAKEYQNYLLKKWGKFYVRGNHDLLPEGVFQLVIGQTMFVHGHLNGDSKRVAKWLRYERQSAGAGWLKQLWVGVADDMDWLKGIMPLPNDVVKSVAALARSYGCTEVILGHFHPLTELRRIENGVTVRCLPKGMNHIMIKG